jgi:predicted dehydrogenase
MLQFDSGAIGEIHIDYVQRAYRRSCQIIGDEGTILWDSQTDTVRLYTARTGGWQEFPNPTGWVPNDMYIEEMRHFLRCLEGKEKPMQDVFEAERNLSVALAAKTSAATGCIVEIDATKNPQTIPQGKG